jgi:hypothetical protein
MGFLTDWGHCDGGESQPEMPRFIAREYAALEFDRIHGNQDLNDNTHRRQFEVGVLKG